MSLIAILVQDNLVNNTAALIGFKFYINYVGLY